MLVNKVSGYILILVCFLIATEVRNQAQLKVLLECIVTCCSQLVHMHGLHFYISLYIKSYTFTMQSKFLWLYVMIVYPLLHLYCVTLKTIQ